MRIRSAPIFDEKPDVEAYLHDVHRAINRMLVMTPCWFQQNVAAGQTNVALNLLGTADNSTLTFPRVGRVIGISVASNAARTAGTLTVVPVANGTASTTFSAVLDATNTTRHSALQASAQNTDIFEENQTVGVQITTTGAWAPTTADIVVNLFVDF